MFTQFYNTITNIPEGTNIKDVVVSIMLVAFVLTVVFFCLINVLRSGSLKIILQNFAISLFFAIYSIFTILWDLCLYPSWIRNIPV
jgi:hypothetical protein